MYLSSPSHNGVVSSSHKPVTWQLPPVGESIVIDSNKQSSAQVMNKLNAAKDEASQEQDVVGNPATKSNHEPKSKKAVSESGGGGSGDPEAQSQRQCKRNSASGADDGGDGTALAVVGVKCSTSEPDSGTQPNKEHSGHPKWARKLKDCTADNKITGSPQKRHKESHLVQYLI
ncbi:hypothetical protein Moror_11052 [Moniliophthora roreri MCA 2997]|uniref:Uncharacterized protein n=1 Tax=Moniliophthora roreri (strain MCA 2997) TaxID=1381753 RepID=V2WWJ3_MONRO|nr:hypothetical protein Moror_11052 [Moniliophthora roreri MCA 2997]